MKNQTTRNGKKNSGKLISVLKVIGLVILCATVSLGSVAISKNFKHELNPNNLIKVDENYIKSQNTARGVEIDVDEDGVITLSGKATSAQTVTVATVELQPGKYVISGVNKPNIDEFGMRIMYGDGNVAFADTDSAKFEITKAETVTILLYWADDYDFGTVIKTKVEPVLVAGETAGEIYK
jgi:hypothetical protein